MNKKYALVENNVVVNTTLWDGVSQWSPENGIAIPAGNDVGIGWLYADGVFTDPDINDPDLTNEEKRKNALLILSVEYKNDITELNTAWLSAAVSDGINKTSKKDAVIAQINERKTKYSTDRAAIIAQYPEE
ncbi:phage tail protein [Citrobacter braakii]|uniref:phage tail protein n=1 Tax=Citrobacter braakii TaxID=57706 RepID=UPI0032C1D437